MKMRPFAIFAEELLIFKGANFMPINWPSANRDERRLFESISILTDNEHSLLEFLFDPKTPRLRKRPGILRDDSWNLQPGEMLLVRAALDIWSGSGHLAFLECLETWDKNDWINFVKAICHLKGIDLLPSEKVSNKLQKDELYE